MSTLAIHLLCCTVLLKSVLSIVIVSTHEHRGYFGFNKVTPSADIYLHDIRSKFVTKTIQNVVLSGKCLGTDCVLALLFHVKINGNLLNIEYVEFL